MEWKKSNISQSELEKQQQTYIKEALEMAKRSAALQFEKLVASEKARNEFIAAEKTETKPIAAEKTEIKPIAAEKTEIKPIAAEKTEIKPIASEKTETEPVTTEKTEIKPVTSEKTETEPDNIKDKEETDTFIIPKEAETDSASYSGEILDQSDKDCVIDIEEVRKTIEIHEKNNSSQPQLTAQNNTVSRKQVAPPNFNRYINDHNRNQCNCPNCQKRRTEQH